MSLTIVISNDNNSDNDDIYYKTPRLPATPYHANIISTMGSYPRNEKSRHSEAALNRAY